MRILSRSLTSLVIAIIITIVVIIPPAFALDEALTEQVLRAKEPSSLTIEKTRLEKANPSTDEWKKVDVLEPAPNKTNLEKLPPLHSFRDPPLQSKTGPGGSDYTYQKVKLSRHCLNTTQQQCPQKQDEYWIFEPSNDNENLQVLPNLPLIVFLHGWSLMSPNFYGGWIEHIVKKGNIVIFPVFQNNPTTEITAQSVQVAVNVIIDATKDSIKKLRTEYPKNENIANQKIALIGHSAGGAMAADVAAKIAPSATEQPTFNPVAIVSVEPYAGNLPPYDLSKIPANSVLLSIAGDQDIIARKKDAEKIFWQTTNISPQPPQESKDFVEVKCDLTNHSNPICAGLPITDLTCPIEDNATDCLTAGHLAPLSYKKITEQTEEGSQLIAFLKSSFSDNSDVRYSDIWLIITELEKLIEKMTKEQIETFLTTAFEANAIDYYSFWKLSVALSNLAFYGKEREYALGNTNEQKDMGQWSSKWPVPPHSVKQLFVTVNPGE